MKVRRPNAQVIPHDVFNFLMPDVDNLIEYICKQCGATRLRIIWSKPNKDGYLCPQCRKAAKGKNRGAKHGMWRGGRIKHSGGYIYAHLETLSPNEQALFESMVDKKGYILEHRLVAARSLGRALTDDEIAHHENGRRDDNRPENIAVFACSGDHLRHHAKLRAATP